MLVIPIDKLIKNMLKEAKPLVQTYRMRLGKDDRMEYVLSPENASNTELSDSVRRRMIRFVPYRLLAPFFADKTKGLTPDAKNRRIKELAESEFDSNNPPPYKLIGEGRNIKAIEMNPAWHAYILKNIALVRGWANWHWVLFLESRNPSRPNVSKILSKNYRQGMTPKRNFWGKVMQASPIKCVYSGIELSVDSFALDHYIPLHFIGHNQLWNLIPACPQANLEKSDSLPDSCYLDGFIKMHHKALTVCRQQLVPKNDIDRAFTEYEEGLNIDVETKMEFAELEKAYHALVPPLLTIARSYGFPNWKYKKQ